MADKKQTVASLKEFGKNVFKGATYGSILDPDMTEKKAKETPEFSTKQVLNHITGKEKLSDQEVEELKRATKYTRFL